MTTCKECGAQIAKGKELLHARWHGEQDAKPPLTYFWYGHSPSVRHYPSYDNVTTTGNPNTTITWGIDDSGANWRATT